MIVMTGMTVQSIYPQLPGIAPQTISKTVEGVVPRNINLFKAITSYLKTWGIELITQRSEAQVPPRKTWGFEAQSAFTFRRIFGIMIVGLVNNHNIGDAQVPFSCHRES
jgi:hypothetical protein